jgi:hypothetical protein
MDYNDFYGFATRDEFMDWAVAQFKEHAGIVISDKSAMIYDEETEQDGCCEICYTVDVRVVVRYEDAALKYKGYYSYSGDDLVFRGDDYPWDVDVPVSS